MAVPHKTIQASAQTPATEWATSPPRSALVTRLAQPGIDPAKRRIRAGLLLLSDAQLQAGLGLSEADIAALRAAGREDAPAVVKQPELAQQTRPVKRLRRVPPAQRVPVPARALLHPRLAKAEAVPA
jgi:hypothetical protein